MSIVELARRHWAFLIVFLVLGFVLFSTIRDGQDWGGDFSIYVLEARNFAEHRAFDQTSYVPTPESMINHPGVYPPLTSIILAPVYAAAGLNYRAFKTVLITLLWLSIPLYYILACRRGLTPAVAAAVMLIFGLSPLVMTIKELIGSDSVFLFLSAATLLCLDEVYGRGWDERHAVASALFTAVLLLLCYFARATGLAVIGAFLLYELWRARRLRPFGALTMLFTLVAVILYSKFAFHAAQQYGTQFPFLPRMYLENTVYYLQSTAVLWAAAPAFLRYGLASVTVACAIAGFFRRLQRPSIIEPYVILSIAVLITYSLTRNTRYMLPVLPFVLFYAAEGLYSAVRLLPLSDASRRMALTGFGLLAVLSTGFNLRALETGPIREGVEKPSFVEVCAFLKRETPQNALVLSWNPRVFALYTGKDSALYPQSSAAAGFESRIPRRGPVFLVYYDQSLDRQRLTPYLQEASTRIRLVFQNQDFRVYALPPGT